MNPDRHASSHYDYFKDLIKGDDASAEAHRTFYDEYNAVLDMDADYYLETIRIVFQEFDLVNGTWDVKSPEGVLERVRPQDIHATGLLTIEGELDDISGSGQTRAAHELCTGVPADQQQPLRSQGRGPLRHLQRASLARTGLSRGARPSSPRTTSRRSAPRALEGDGTKTPSRRPRRQSAPPWQDRRAVARKAAPRKARQPRA